MFTSHKDNRMNVCQRVGSCSNGIFKVLGCFTCECISVVCTYDDDINNQAHACATKLYEGASKDIKRAIYGRYNLKDFKKD